MKSLAVIVTFLALLFAVQAGGIPAGTAGFSGLVAGKIVKKQNGTLQIKVNTVLKTWKTSTAPQPENLVGQTIVVGPGYARSADGGRGEINKYHVAFIDKVRPGDIVVEVRAAEDGFVLLELTRAQRDLAAGE